jgi:hypothetical protein
MTELANAVPLAQETDPAPACPRCKSATQVQPVAQIVAVGLPTVPAAGSIPLTWQDTTYYIPRTQDMASETRLACRLFPSSRMRHAPVPEAATPPRFQPRAVLGCAMPVLLGALLVRALFADYWLYVLVILLLCAAGAFARNSIYVKAERSWLGNGMSMYGATDRKVDAALAAFDSSKPAYQHALRKAEAKQAQAAARWRAAYYCRHDDILFVRGSAQVATPEQMDSLCYA